MSLRVGPLVRAISASSVVIWAELSRACTVTISIRPIDLPEHEQSSIRTSTITVGNRHYIAPQIHGLQPATWYTYHVHIPSQVHASPESTNSSLFYGFRTFAEPITGDEGTGATNTGSTALRIAYGSCRKLAQPQDDTLHMFGAWLQQQQEQREERWPHLLLLIGDQIYADEPPPPLLVEHPELQSGATTFEQFASMYEYAWTISDEVRQVFAAIPTFMTFDDHEITNSWNLSPDWRAKALENGLETRLVDGLVAYWVYQGWGNLHSRSHATHPLLQIMQTAEQSGEDALPALRACVRDEVYAKRHLDWHYTIPCTPPIFVSNTRAHRSTIFSTNPDDICISTSIMDQAQMDELSTWVQQQGTDPAIMVSSVPVLLPPVIGLAEYLMGLRPWQHSPTLLRQLGVKLAHQQLRLAEKTSFDHWPVFSDSWQRLIKLLKHAQRNMLVLSGDVHFSYACAGRLMDVSGQQRYLYQCVSTPIENRLESASERKIALQSFIRHSSYGGLHTEILPLQGSSGTIRRNLLYQNTIAMLTLTSHHAKHYQMQQDYLGITRNGMEIIAQTVFPAPTP